MLFQIFKDENYIKFFLLLHYHGEVNMVNFKSLHNFSGY